MGAEEVAAMTCPVKQASGQPDQTRKIAGYPGYIYGCSSMESAGLQNRRLGEQSLPPVPGPCMTMVLVHITVRRWRLATQQGIVYVAPRRMRRAVAPNDVYRL